MDTQLAHFIMKKTFATILLSAVLLAGCQTATDGVDTKKSDLPDSFYQKNSELLEMAKESQEKSPTDFTAQFEVAYRYHMLGKQQDAIREYEKAFKLMPTDYATLNNLAVVYEEMKDYSSAAKYIKKLYELNQDNSEVISDTVRILLENNEPKEAAKALENFAKTRRDQKKTDPSEFQLVSELYQSIDRYNKQHDKK